MSGNADIRRALEERRAARRRELDAARRAAAASGKEAFDLDRFETMHATSTDLGALPPRDEREFEWAYKYYVSYPELRTMAELARQQQDIDATMGSGMERDGRDA